MRYSTLQNCTLAAIVFIGLLMVAEVIFALFLTSRGVDSKQCESQLGCQSVATAFESYVEHSANARHELPTTLNDLAHPPFGGPAFLRNGEADLLDPWGKPYEMERRQWKDGAEFILVKTTAPDGTPISQFGIG